MIVSSQSYNSFFICNATVAETCVYQTLTITTQKSILREREIRSHWLRIKSLRSHWLSTIGQTRALVMHAERRSYMLILCLGEKSVIALSTLFTKDLLEKQKSWSLGGKIQTEPENKVTLCKIHANSPKSNGMELQVEEKQLSETCLTA